MNKKLKRLVSLSIFLLWLLQAIFTPVGKDEPGPGSNPPQGTEEKIPPIIPHSPGWGIGDKNRN